MITVTHYSQIKKIEKQICNFVATSLRRHYESGPRGQQNPTRFIPLIYHSKETRGGEKKEFYSFFSSGNCGYVGVGRGGDFNFPIFGDRREVKKK